MTTLVSERHKLKFYLTIILGSLFFLAMGTALLIAFLNNAKEGDLKPKEYLLPIFSLSVYFMAFYTVYKYYKNAPKIIVDKNTIAFNGQTFSLAELEHLELTGKRNFPYLFSFPMEAATLQFKDGQTKYIFDDMYQNSWMLKSFLKQVVIEKKEFLPGNTLPVDDGRVEYDFYETFKDSQLLSFRGLSLWGLIGFFSYLLINNKRPNTVGLLIFITAFSTFWFIMLSYQMHYFQVSNGYFLVRNHNFFWKKKVYNLSNLQEIVFETQGKMPNCLRVITKDFRNKLYPAGTLSDKTWLQLKDRLEAYGIKVRNECI